MHFNETFGMLKNINYTLIFGIIWNDEKMPKKN